MKSGFVSLIGRPNTGKSTLLNTILKEKVAIISNKPQTTRNLVQGIYNEEDTQIVFVDTPGIHKPIDKLGTALNAQAYYSINDVDVLLLVVDASVPYGKGDQFIINKLENIDKPVFLILNKIDKLSNEQILLKINEYKDLYEFAEIIPLSALKDEQINEAKKIAAFEITKLIHGEEEAKKAEEAAQALFEGNGSLDNMPTTKVEENISILDAIIQTGIAPSKGQARTLIEQGGISLNDNKISDTTYVLSSEDFKDGYAILKKGKKVYHKLEK